MTETIEHPFAQYVRILGKGKNSGRSLTREEAQTAFTMVLNGEVEDIQLGALLLLLRVKGENAEEMAGFAQACRDHIAAPEISVDIDWPSYAGKRKQLPWFLLSALLLAENGYRIFMHGCAGHTANRVYSEAILGQLDIPLCRNWAQVKHNLSQGQFAYANLESFCAPLARLFHMRNTLGVRSPAHSLIKLVNPLNASTALQSVFHPAYLEVHQHAATLLNYPASLVIKGEGGEIEFRPDADNRLFLVNGSDETVQSWTRRQPSRQTALETANLCATPLQNLWRSKGQDATKAHDYDLNAVIGTAAMVIFAHHRQFSEEEAWDLARQYWDQRNKDRL